MTRPPIPRGPEEVTAQWMQQALTAGGASDLPPVKEIAWEDIGSGVGFMGTILRCSSGMTSRKRWLGRIATLLRPLSSSAQSARQEPASGQTPGLHRRGYDFYRLIAPQAPVRSPALLYGDYQAGRRSLCPGAGGFGGWQTVSHFDGASAEQTRRAIRAIARLHGTYWNRTDQPPLNLLTDTFSSRRRMLVQLVYLAHLAPTLERFGSYFSDDMRRLAETYAARIDSQIVRVAAGPKTLSHGDFRLDNIFFAADSGEEIAIIDWQVSGLRSPLFDVAYFWWGALRPRCAARSSARCWKSTLKSSVRWGLRGSRSRRAGACTENTRSPTSWLWSWPAAV